MTYCRYRVPLKGFSHSATRTGALSTLNAGLAQIDRQATEGMRQALIGLLVRPHSPVCVDVSGNEPGAHALGADSPVGDTLQRHREKHH